jgi:hypothetical protein
MAAKKRKRREKRSARLSLFFPLVSRNRGIYFVMHLGAKLNFARGVRGWSTWNNC